MARPMHAEVGLKGATTVGCPYGVSNRLLFNARQYSGASLFHADIMRNRYAPVKVVATQKPLTAKKSKRGEKW